MVVAVVGPCSGRAHHACTFGGTVTGLSAQANRRLTIAAVATGVILSLAADDWLPGAAVAVLWVIWRVLPDDSGPPILSIALTYQWGQVTVGMIYAVVTGRTLLPMLEIDYHPIIIMSLTCLLVMTGGLWLGRWLIQRTHRRSVMSPNLAFG